MRRNDKDKTIRLSNAKDSQGDLPMSGQKEGIESRLIELFKRGELVPVTRCKSLKGVSPATRCRLVLKGTIPALRVGCRLLTHDSLVEESLINLVVAPKPSGAGKPSENKMEHSAQVWQMEEARERLKKRGMKLD